jgi:hypothetical protein
MQEANSSPVGINPLTGLPCDDPALLGLPPALVSVSNFPVTARPQAGLSFSPYVFEMYIGEGMTRFLAMFYCSFPSENVSGDNTIGPIRSGRLPYESLRKLYNGFLIMASASGDVSTHLNGSTNIFGTEADNINSALIDVSKLKGLAQRQAGSTAPNLTGNLLICCPQAERHPAWVFATPQPGDVDFRPPGLLRRCRWLGDIGPDRNKGDRGAKASIVLKPESVELKGFLLM